MRIGRKRRESSTDDVEATLGDVVRNERLQQGLEQEDVARMAGVPVLAVQNLERNDFTIPTAKAVLTALGVEYLDK